MARIHPAKMARIWQVNYQSAYESIHEALPHFLNQGSGHILLTSSILGKKGMAYGAPYCATKFAQVGLAESLWGELRDKGIGVTVICPGYTRTEFHQASELPDGTGPSRGSLKGQSAKEVAEAMVASVLKKKREVTLSRPGKALVLLDRIWPGGASRVMAKVGSKARGAREERSPASDPPSTA